MKRQRLKRLSRTAQQRCNIVVFLSVLVSPIAMADYVSVVATPPFHIEDTDTFFESYCSKSDPPTRDPFETDAQYQKKLPSPWDTTKVVYFEIPDTGQFEEIGLTSELKDLGISTPVANSHDLLFKYDIDNHGLIIYGGAPAGNLDLWSPDKTILVKIKTILLSHRQYEGSNAFGASVTVTEETYRSDLLAIHMPKKFLKNRWYFPEEGRFQVGFNMSPDTAKTLVKHVELVAAVHLRGYSDSFHGLDWDTKPTITSPYSETDYVDGIEADLVKVIVYDTENQKVVAEVDAN